MSKQVSKDKDYENNMCESCCGNLLLPVLLHKVHGFLCKNCCDKYTNVKTK